MAGCTLELKKGVTVGLFAALTVLGIAMPTAFSEEAGSNEAQAVPEIVQVRGLVSYQTNRALLPAFVERLGLVTGLDLQGLELLEETQLSSEEGLEPVPELIARLLNGYNYVLAFTADEGARTGRSGTLIITGRRGSLVQADSTRESAKSPDSEILEVGEGRGRREAGTYGEQEPSPGEWHAATALPKSPEAIPQPRAQPVQPTVGSMLNDQLDTLRNPSSRFGYGNPQMFVPPGMPQAPGNSATASAQARPAGAAESPVDIQEATRRALLSVQEMARALDAASAQLFPQKR